MNMIIIVIIFTSNKFLFRGPVLRHTALNAHYAILNKYIVIFALNIWIEIYCFYF